MKILVLVLIHMFGTFIFAQNVVINEVLYDPDGADSGYEWIELYNDSDIQQNLQDWTIEKAGTSFTLLYTLPDIIIESNSFLLIGEEFVPDTELTTILAFQNGGSETDGIRLTSADGFYTDTILYDSPNSNGLPDDITNPGGYFAIDVADGNTLARKHDGEDSNNCELDYFECTQPTPGGANFYPIDLAISNLEIYENDGEYWLQTEVANLSTENVDNQAASIDIVINDTHVGTYELPAIPAQSTIDFSCQIGELSIRYHQIMAELIYFYDNELANNIAHGSLLNGASPFVLNEIMFKPLNTNQEWVEIFNRTDCVYDVDNLRIIDASGSIISFGGNIPPLDFIVLCQDTILFLQTYPGVDPEKVIFASEWTSLNNTDETLILTDEFETKFDSTSYNGNNCPSDFSIERIDPYDDESILWNVCFDSLGTPTFPNSVMPKQFDIELEFANMQINGSSIEHFVTIINVGLEDIFDATISCDLIINGEYPTENIYSEEIILEDSLMFSFITDLPQNGYFSYAYEVTSEEDMNAANNIDYGYYNGGSLPFVVNEIMYDPDVEEPEWIEITNNLQIPDLSEVILVVDEDTLKIPYCDETFYLVTNSNADADTLRAMYDLNGITIFTGLPSLSNDGEQILLMDECENIIEEFFFEPDWNDDLDGVSIERVNPEIQSNAQNWGPSTNGSTPGRANSIFVQMLPANVKLSVAPNPFSPYRDERTIFSYVLPEVLSTVTLRIFDLKGRMIRRLVDQVLQSSAGNIIWDGKNDSGKNLPIGVYIVLMQATSRESEKVYSKKITVVVGK